MAKELKEICAGRYKHLLPQCASIAADIGISYQAVYYWLRGKHSFSLDRFIKFCKSVKLNPATELNQIIKEMEAKNEK